MTRKSTLPPDYICRQSVELTAKLLTLGYLPLSQQLNDLLSRPEHQDKNLLKRKEAAGFIELFDNQDLIKHLKPEVIGQILHALTSIAEDAIAKHPVQLNNLVSWMRETVSPSMTHAQLVSVVAHLIEDWSYVLEWILGHSTITQPTHSTTQRAFH